MPSGRDCESGAGAAVSCLDMRLDRAVGNFSSAKTESPIVLGLRRHLQSFVVRAVFPCGEVGVPAVQFEVRFGPRWPQPVPRLAPPRTFHRFRLSPGRGRSPDRTAVPVMLSREIALGQSSQAHADSDQVFIEHRNRECCVTVRWAVDHSLFDERASYRSDAFHGRTQFGSDVP